MRKPEAGIDAAVSQARFFIIIKMYLFKMVGSDVRHLFYFQPFFCAHASLP